MHVVTAITGASGSIYGYTLLKALKRHEVSLIVSEDAKTVIKEEMDHDVHDFEKLARHVYSNDDLSAPISSGSNRFDVMVIIPCSGTTLAKIACGIADNLITRVASVCLKEKRRLVIVPRETPLSQVQLENLLKLASMGVTILPASPGFYSRPKMVQDIVDFVVARTLDQMSVEHKILKGWKTG